MTEIEYLLGEKDLLEGNLRASRLRCEQLEEKLQCVNEALEQPNYRAEVKPLAAMCEPLIQYLEKNHDPHTEIVITCDGVRVNQTIIWVPQKAVNPED